MPANVVKNPVDEKAWERAKSTVKKQYPDVVQGSKKYFKLVMTVFKDMSMADRPPKSKLQEVLANA